MWSGTLNTLIVPFEGRFIGLVIKKMFYMVHVNEEVLAMI